MNYVLTNEELYESFFDEGVSEPGECLAVLFSEPYPGLLPLMPPEPGDTVFCRSANSASENKREKKLSIHVLAICKTVLKCVLI